LRTAAPFFPLVPDPVAGRSIAKAKKSEICKIGELRCGGCCLVSGLVLPRVFKMQGERDGSARRSAC
jgi:hypothetical protein